MKSFDVMRLAWHVDVRPVSVSDGGISYIDEATTPRSAELHRLFVTAGLGAHFLGLPLLQPTFLPGKDWALLTGGVAGHHLLALLLLHGLTDGHLVLHLVDVVLGPALGLVHRPAHHGLALLPPAVLDDGGPTHLQDSQLSLRLPTKSNFLPPQSRCKPGAHTRYNKLSCQQKIIKTESRSGPGRTRETWSSRRTPPAGWRRRK